ncbi:Uncharacterised protein [Mycobacteroides abscessus subsp. abscessus]|nr:Uncharacterised protein [Mycobacteroides abscessus subsp. abscessus]
MITRLTAARATPTVDCLAWSRPANARTESTAT